MLNIMHTRFMYCSLLVVYILLLLASMCTSTRTTMHTLAVCIILCIQESKCMAAYGEFLGGNGKNCCIVYTFKARPVDASRDGLVGYDAALTQLRSGVRFPSTVRFFFCHFTQSSDHKARQNTNIVFYVCSGVMKSESKQSERLRMKQLTIV